jgi:dipeptidyl-peptidase III
VKFLKGGGNRKIIPEISIDEFSLICSISPTAQRIYETISDRIFSSEPAVLGFPGSGGMCGFYPDSPDIEQLEIEQLQKYLMGNGYFLQNTRLQKSRRENGTVLYRVLIASVNDHAPAEKGTKYDPIDYESNKTIEFKFGDHSRDLNRACIWLKKGLSVASSDAERRYIQELVNFFQSGDIDIDKKASIEWIRNSNPAVEVWIGFLSGYRDPAGVRRSMEGVVAIQDRESSKHIDRLSEIAQDLIKLLPWVSPTGANQFGPFELDSYTRPQFLAINSSSYVH